MARRSFGRRVADRGGRVARATHFQNRLQGAAGILPAELMKTASALSGIWRRGSLPCFFHFAFEIVQSLLEIRSYHSVHHQAEVTMDRVPTQIAFV